MSIFIYVSKINYADQGTAAQVIMGKMKCF